jgi:hypothetical protein
MYMDPSAQQPKISEAVRVGVMTYCEQRSDHNKLATHLSEMIHCTTNFHHGVHSRLKGEWPSAIFAF